VDILAQTRVDLRHGCLPRLQRYASAAERRGSIHIEPRVPAPCGHGKAMHGLAFAGRRVAQHPTNRRAGRKDEEDPMKIAELVRHWENEAKGNMTRTRYSIPLDLEAAARLAALAEMYPKRSTEALLGELVSAALEAVETSMPYEQGSEVITTDEQGDPVYEDIGPTPRFLELSKKHLLRLQQEQQP